MRVPVTAPPATPPTFGLVASARPVTEADERWVLGLSWDPEACGPSGTGDPCARAARAINGNDRPAVVDYQPFMVWAEDECTTLGARGAERARAARRLLACESKQIESELWRGDQARLSGWDNEYLASPAADDLGAGASFAVVDALAALEEGLAACSCGGVGMIHATVQTVTLWRALDLVERQANGLITTVLGTIVVAGAGYDGSAPGYGSGADPAPIDPVADGSSAWAYGTQRVELRRSAIAVLGGDDAGLNRSLNDVEVRAERAAAATFDPCCHVGVLVDFSRMGV